MKALLVALLLTAAPDAGVPAHEHCWHPSSMQHAVPNHSDDVCCHCGMTRCRTFPPPSHEGHGPFIGSP